VQAVIAAEDQLRQETTERVATPVLEDTEDDDQDDEETQVSVITVNGKQFLMDDQFLVYDFTSQEHIGNFDNSTQSIIFL